MSLTPSTPPRQNAVRATRQFSRDPRQAQTRAAIIRAVHELVRHGHPMPSVPEIVKVAGVSRSSFYTQFANRESLMTEVVKEAFEQARLSDTELRGSGTLSGFESTRITIEQIVAHFSEHQAFYRACLPATLAAHDEVLGIVIDQFQQSGCVSRAPEFAISTHAAATFLAAGMLNLLRAWVAGDVTSGERELTQQILALFPAWMLSTPDRHTAPSPAGQLHTEELHG